MADEKQAAATGAATSVADAVKRVADAAVAEVSRVRPASKHDFTTSGVAGGRITVEGSGFGASGTLKVNGAQVHTMQWSSQRIVGKLPAEAHTGNVEVLVDDKTVKRGWINL